MAWCGASLSWSVEGVGTGSSRGNLSTILASCSYFDGRSLISVPRQSWKVRCRSSSRTSSPLEYLDNLNAKNGPSVSVEEEMGPVIKFNISDFKVLNSVSIGLGGKV